MFSKTSTIRFCRTISLLLLVGTVFGCGGGGGSNGTTLPVTTTTTLQKADVNAPRFAGLTAASSDQDTGNIKLTATEGSDTGETPTANLTYLIWVSTVTPVDQSGAPSYTFTGGTACTGGICTFTITDLKKDGSTLYYFASHVQDASLKRDTDLHPSEASLSVRPTILNGVTPRPPLPKVSLNVNTGANSTTALSAVHPSMTVFNGVPYVIWEECVPVIVTPPTPAPAGWSLDHPCDTTVASSIYLKRFNSQTNSWDLVKSKGGADSLNINTGHAHSPTLTSDGTNLYASWREYGHGLYVETYDGSQWSVTNPSITITVGNAADRPALTRHSALGANLGIGYDYAPGDHQEIFFRQWDGSTLTPLGSTLNIDSAQVGEAASFSKKGTDLYLSWKETTPAGATAWNIFVKKWTGSAWAAVGGSLNINGTFEARYPSVDVLGTTPYVAWHECLDSGCGKRYIFVRHWDGANWVQDKDTSIRPEGCPDVATCTGTLNAGGRSAEPPSLVVLGTQLYVAWAERYDLVTAPAAPFYRIQWKTFKDGQWSYIGILNNDQFQDAHSPVLIAGNDGTYAAWVEQTSTNGAYQLRVQ